MLQTFSPFIALQNTGKYESAKNQGNNSMGNKAWKFILSFLSMALLISSGWGWKGCWFNVKFDHRVQTLNFI